MNKISNNQKTNEHANAEHLEHYAKMYLLFMFFFFYQFDRLGGVPGKLSSNAVSGEGIRMSWPCNVKASAPEPDTAGRIFRPVSGCSDWK